MEQDNYSSSSNGRDTQCISTTLTEAERVTFAIDGLKVLIEGVKALSIMKLIFQIQVTTNELEREQLEQTLQMMVATLY